MAIFSKPCDVKKVSYLNRVMLLATCTDKPIYMIASGLPKTLGIDVGTSLWNVNPMEGVQAITRRGSNEVSQGNYLRVKIEIATQNSSLAYYLFERADQWQLQIYGREPDWPDLPDHFEEQKRKQFIREAGQKTNLSAIDWRLREDLDDFDQYLEMDIENTIIHEMETYGERIYSQPGLWLNRIDVLNFEVSTTQGANGFDLSAAFRALNQLEFNHWLEEFLPAEGDPWDATQETQSNWSLSEQLAKAIAPHFRKK